MWRVTHRQTDRQTDTQMVVTNIHFASATPHAKYNNRICNYEHVITNTWTRTYITRIYSLRCSRYAESISFLAEIMDLWLNNAASTHSYVVTNIVLCVVLWKATLKPIGKKLVCYYCITVWPVINFISLIELAVGHYVDRQCHTRPNNVNGVLVNCNGNTETEKY